VNYFTIRENRKYYIEWLKDKVGIKDENLLETKHFDDNGGGGLLALYHGSPKAIIESLNSKGDPMEVGSVLKRSTKPQKFWVQIHSLLKSSVKVRIGFERESEDFLRSNWSSNWRFGF
jgi:hypothetical protein